MKNALLFLWVCLLPLEVFGRQEAGSGQTALVFTHVTVIDATGAPAKPDMTVVIKGDRIAALGKTDEVDVPEDAQVVDAAGKCVIPGLWDMHVHVTQLGSATLPMFPAYGVTGVRDMGSDPDLVFLWRREIAEGARLGPRIVTSGQIINGPMWSFSAPSTIQVSTPDEGCTAVKEMARLGADFIKVHSWLSRETYFAVIDEANRQGLFIAGHVPPPVRFEEAVEAGQRGIEHQIGLPIALSSEEPKLLAELLEAMRCAPPDIWAKFRVMIRTDAAAVDTYDEEVARRLFGRFAALGVWVCPTLTITRAWTVMKDSLRADPRLKYLPSTLVDSWIADTDGMTPEDVANWRQLLPTSLRSVGAMHRAGVRLLAGTDAGATYDFPGSDLHRELSLLVEAGLSPLAALQAATRDAAEAVGMADSLGTIEVGKVADLVLLEANPLQDISNTQRINAVVVGGKILQKAALQKILAQIEATAKKSKRK